MTHGTRNEGPHADRGHAAGGHLPLSEHIPQRRQSIAPPRMMVIMLMTVLALIAVIGVAVGLSVAHGGKACNSSGHTATETRCR
ncbi:MAG TPA: hypothetical protein VH857_13045 [Actinomycetes bacterium]|nr:hypothetical protein [Actinomycetes bacterium]